MKNYYYHLIIIAAYLCSVSIVQSGAVLKFITCLINRRHPLLRYRCFRTPLLRTKSPVKNIYCVNIFLMLLPMKVFASEENPSPISTPPIISTDPMSGSYLIQLILGLIVVLICIVALAWFAKRMNRLQSSTGGVLKIIGGLSMGSRERVVLIQVGSEQLLIGVSPGRINTLHVLEAPLEDVGINAEKTFATSLAEAVFQKNSVTYRQKTNDA